MEISTVYVEYWIRLKWNLKSLIFVSFFTGKNIINEQFLLNRLAQATIDIYVTTCMVSRCTQSLNEGLPSAMHEELMTKVCTFASALQLNCVFSIYHHFWSLLYISINFFFHFRLLQMKLTWEWFKIWELSGIQPNLTLSAWCRRFPKMSVKIMHLFRAILLEFKLLTKSKNIQTD